jgi:hypothetical protein
VGGPLAVRAAKEDDAEQEYEFTLPRFTGIVELPQAACRSLKAGEFGYVTIRPARPESIAQTLNRRVHAWIEDKWTRAKQAAGA